MKEFVEKQPGQQVEKILFHGTNDEKAIKCICHQNFDFRMHGKNATMFGKGMWAL